jgi:DNA-directed RNA polymerase subunit K/omega
LNSELVNQASELTPSPHVLINTISRRVRQLNSGGGGSGRPLIEDTSGLGLADIALTEMIEEKITWEKVDPEEIAQAEAAAATDAPAPPAA